MGKPSWQLYLYRVDFSHENAKQHHLQGALVRQIQSFGPYIIDDGEYTMLYLTIKLEDQITEFVMENESVTRVTLTFVDMVSVETHQYMHVLKQILEKSLRCLHMQSIRRNFYDFSALVKNLF